MWQGQILKRHSAEASICREFRIPMFQHISKIFASQTRGKGTKQRKVYAVDHGSGSLKIDHAFNGKVLSATQRTPHIRADSQATSGTVT